MLKTERQLVDDMMRSFYRLRKASSNTISDGFDFDLDSLRNELGFLDREKIRKSKDLDSFLKKMVENLDNLEFSDIDEAKVKKFSDEMADALGINNVEITIKTPENKAKLKFKYPEEKTSKIKCGDFDKSNIKASFKEDEKDVDLKMYQNPIIHKEDENNLSSEMNGIFDMILGLGEKKDDVDSKVEDKIDTKCDGKCDKCDFFELDFDSQNGAPLNNSELKERIFKGENLDDIFDIVDEWRDGYARVRIGDKFNMLSMKMKLMSDIWYDFISDFENGYAIVILNHVCNAIDKNGNLVSEQWYDGIDLFYDGLAAVYLNDKCNFINEKGELLSDEWFDCAERFNSGIAEVMMDGKSYHINTDGKIVDDNDDDDVYTSETDQETLEEDIEERKRYFLMDVGGDFNAPFYNAVRYICETVHFPNSDFYTYEDELDLNLNEVDAVILLPNVWEKMLDYYVNKYGKYIDEGGKLYVIDTESFELTLVNHSLELMDYQMNDVQESLITRK